MNDPAPVPLPAPAPPPLRLEPDLICADCGAHGAVAFDGIQLCLRCYAEKGAGCAGPGREPGGDA